jgi:uncharacterized SAM-binding protein YcdF (DUF218 family)
MLSVLDNVISDFASWIAIGLATALAAALRTWWAIQRRLRKIEDELNMSSDETRVDAVESVQAQHRRYLTGDPEDPTSPGVLSRMKEMDSKLDRIIEHVEREENGPDQDE